MKNPARLLRSALMLLAVFLFTGCVSKKYQIASAVSAIPQQMNLALGGAPVNTRLEAVIIFQGPGSWKKSAYWDEFVVTLTSGSAEAIDLTGASLVDFAGVVVPAGTNPWQLEKDSLAQRDRYLRAGVSFALNTLGYAALTYGAVGVGAVAGAALTNTWGGLTAGATVGLVAVPVTAIVIYAKNQRNKRQIEREFTRRRLPLPITLHPGESRSGSLFFPMTVGPRELRMEWTKGGEHGTMVLPLPMLAGMHLKEATR